MKNRILKSMLGTVMISLCLFITKISVMAATDTLQEFVDAYDSVALSPDGTAWTIKGTGSAERNPSHYKLQVGRDITLNVPGVGEHIYDSLITGNVDISYWEVRHEPSQCIHGDEFKGGTYYGEVAGSICGAEYDNGWFPVCADCGEYVFKSLVYAHSDQLKDINTIVGAANHYYLCPFSGSLEQGIYYEHWCDTISANRYRVAYMKNAPEGVGVSGSTARTYHMYNNNPIYEGNPTTYKDTHLRKNGFSATGYVFTGWNTEKDGSGTPYADGQEVLNLTAENNAIVILYAQWKKVDSTLVLDTNGGSYAGYTGPITQGYKSTWTFDESKITAPAGYITTFNHMGGSGTPSLPSTMSYHYFQISRPVSGLLTGRVYTFLGENTTDTITIYYKQDSIILPSSTRSGYSFGGWYSDSACTNPVGRAGDSYTPTGNTTLYAKWVQLVLTSVDDYTSNGGKGAVDLTWSQPDGTNKTYEIYQYSEVDTTHKIVNSATDIGNTNSVNKSFAYSGASGTYTVPYTGYYKLTLNGAQGGNYSTYTGGLGGRTTATMYLKAGEVLTYNIGGQNGYNGGGTASDFGVGGGLSSVSSNLKGTLLIAGGGGGAGAQGNGYAGGSTASVITGNTGEAGMAGGGGGYKGGTAGEYIVHTHTDDCMQEEALDYVWYTNDGGDTPSYLSEDAAVYYGKDYSNAIWHSDRSSGYGWSAHFINGGGYLYSDIYFRVGLYTENGTDKYHYIPTNGNTQVCICATLDLTEERVSEWRQDDTKLVVYDQNDRVIYSKSMAEMEYTDLTEDADEENNYNADIRYDWWVDAGFYGYAKATTTGMADIQLSGSVINGYAGWNDTIDLPEGTTGIRIDWDCVTRHGSTHMNAYMRHIAFKGGVKETPICGYTEGQVISSKGAYGGSNYINTAYCQSHSSEAGKKTGNGAFSIVSTDLGYHDSTTLNDVVATDFAKPDEIDADNVNKKLLNASSVRVSFDKPDDNGTNYYHYVKSYNAVTKEYSLTSNTTLNTLTSGVVKYHYVYNTSSSTTVTTSHSSTANRYVDVNFAAVGEVNYLHIAPVDKAGNIGKTVHIPVKSITEEEDLLIEPKPVTERIGITMGDGVASGPNERTYYVRSDGMAEIELTDNAYLEDDGTRVLAQVDTVRFNVCDSNFASLEWTEATVPRALGAGRYIFGNADLLTNAFGEERMRLSSVGATRYGASNVVVSYKYTIPGVCDGETFYVYPGAYTTHKDKLFCSVDGADRGNYISLICDGTSPEITGLDAIGELNVLDMTEEAKSFVITASDTISGLAEFEIIIENKDNYIAKRIRDEVDGAKDGVITITVPGYQEGSVEGLEFCGNFTVTARAVDIVGNERVESTDATALALEAKLQRILEPHEPAFKRGESGVLTITSWGYVEIVEVEFSEEVRELNKSYDYADNLRYVQEEALEFMIPLTISDGQYMVKVTGFKAGTDLDRRPIILSFSVEGSVLDELRTRLR